jgi:hypothetical protein
MCQVQLHAQCQRLTGRHSYGAVVGLEYLRAARVATPAFQVVWSALHYAYVMAALVMRNIHVDTTADLGLGQITPHMALGDRSAYSGPSVLAKVTVARQSSATATIAGSMDVAICSVQTSIGNESVGVFVNPTLRRSRRRE